MIEEIIKFFFKFIIDIFFVWTGEIILFLVTLGKHSPRWDLYTKQSPARFVIFSEISCLTGMLFWIVCIVILVRYW